MTKPIRSILTGLAVAACAGTLHAETFPVQQDASASPAKPTITAGGKAKTLGISATSTAYLFFDVSSSGITPADVKRARLTIFFPTVTKGGNVSIHKLATGFSENGGAAPSPGTTPFKALALTPQSKSQFAVIDVTTEVKAWLTTTGSEKGFALTGDASVKSAISSKEGAGSGHPPVLEVELTDVPVTTSRLADTAVTSAKLADAAVSSTKLGDNAVTTQKLDSNSVTSAKLADSAVSTTKLADASVTSAKLDSNLTLSGTTSGTFSGSGSGLTGITSSGLAAGSVTASKLDASIGIWSVSGGDVLRSTGNVGIGTTPARRFHVSDTANVVGRLDSSSTVGTWLALGNSSTGGQFWQFISSGSANGGGGTSADRTQQYRRYVRTGNEYPVQRQGLHRHAQSGCHRQFHSAFGGRKQRE